MEPVHFDLWKRCREFVAEVCAGRGPSHGLQHMETVTQVALLLVSMENEQHYRPSRRVFSARVIVVAMLHDVNDHKFDKDGTLSQKVTDFVAKDLLQGSFSFAQVLGVEEEEGRSSLETVAQLIVAAVGAVSFSKEKKNGKRYFEKPLGEEFCAVRDYVSDADKIEVLGRNGLVRCYECFLECFAAKDRAPTDEEVLADLHKHAEEKLLRLKEEYIVTTAGKFIAEPKHHELVEALEEWTRHGPPLLP